jgi:two-component system sensor histidine kinase/response regulator
MKKRRQKIMTEEMKEMKEPINELRPILLVVDDVATNIDILLGALCEEYIVHVATDGADALYSVKKARPDLILLDVMMPGMDGFEVCRRLKDDPTTRDIPVIFITALNETLDKVKGFSVGGVDYVTKPFQPEEVRARVSAHLEIRRQKNELQQSYDKLRETEIQRDSLVHMIVHDMRSPLFVILGNLEMAEMKPLPDVIATCIGRAMSASYMLMEMISTLLDVSKMEAGQMTLEFSEVYMRDLVMETIQMLEPLQYQRRLTLTAPEEMETITGDTRLIRRILLNLIGNALKFTDKDKGIITVCIEIAAKDKMRVSVVDNGGGIPQEYREKVFDKFCQVAAQKQGQGHSTGLGLTFCKLAVEAHGGRIGLESEVGVGSTFWFELPLK